MTGRAFVIEPAIDRNHSGHNLNIIKVLSHALENTEQFYLVSAKEERDLAALLDLFALGVGDVEEFQDRLQAELAALEVTPV